MIPDPLTSELPLPADLFGADAAVEVLSEHDGEVMIGLVEGSLGRWGVVSVDETPEGAWIYVVVPLRADEGTERMTGPQSLRGLLTDAERTVLSLVGTDDAGVQWGPLATPYDGWLPSR